MIEPHGRDSAQRWALSLSTADGGLAGPLQGFVDTRPDVTVGVVSEADIPAGERVGVTHVEESRQVFAVERYRLGDQHGVHHCGSDNWIVWDDAETHFDLTSSAAWDQTWVHVRYLLRHLIVSRYGAMPGIARVHAVVGTLADEPDQAVAIVGPSLAGKSRLMNRMVEQQLVARVVEDDCAVISGGVRVISLIPTQHELRRPETVSLAGLIYLDGTRSPERLSSRDATAFAARCPAPWPAAWLPSTGYRGESAVFPDSLPVLRAPVRSDHIPSVVTAVSDFAASLGRERMTAAT